MIGTIIMTMSMIIGYKNESNSDNDNKTTIAHTTRKICPSK